MPEPRISPAVKAIVAERARFCCEYCLSQLHDSPDPFSSDHFMWSTDRTEILGLTRTGRATVQRLALNRTGVVNLRRTLVAIGKHPPG